MDSIKTENQYYRVDSGNVDGLDLARRWRANARRTLLCKTCREPLPLKLSAVHLDHDASELSRRIAYYFVRFGGPSILNRIILNRLPKSVVADDVMLADVFDVNGSMLDEWVAVACKRHILVRGKNGVSFKLCRSCGRRLYFAWDFPGYLTRQPNGAVAIYRDRRSLVVRSDVFELGFQGLRCRSKLLPIREKPLDGLPRDIGAFPNDPEFPDEGASIGQSPAKKRSSMKMK